MQRNPNTTGTGRPFPRGTVLAVWRKGTIVPGYDSRRVRKDGCGAWMDWASYGDTSTIHGWEIDHAKPVSKGGSDHLANLQPLNWKNNRSKGDSYPNWSCAVTAA